MTGVQDAAFWCIDGAWLLWLIVWMAMAQWVKKTLAREPLLRRAAHIVPLILAVGLLVFCLPALGALTCRNVASRAAWLAPAGAIVTVAGLGFAVWARVTLARNWSGIVTLKQDHELVCTGPYGVVRHPIYTGLLTALLGTAIAIDQWRGVLALTIVAASFLAKMRTEEAFMSRAFGAAYADYKRDVPALIPKLRKSWGECAIPPRPPVIHEDED